MYYHVKIIATTASIDPAQVRTAFFDPMLFKKMIDNTSDLMAVCSPEGRYLYINPASTKVLGYAEDEVLGQLPFDLIHPEDRPKVLELYDACLKNKIPGKAEYRILHKDGEYVWLQTEGDFVFNAAGEPEYLLFTSRDITDTKKLVHRLSKYEKIIENSTDFHWRFLFPRTGEISDIRDLKFASATTQSTRIFGFTPAEYLTKTLKEILTPASITLVLQIFSEEVARLKSLGRPDPDRERSFDIQQYHKDGSIVDINVTAKFIFDDDGRIAGLQGTSRNITERKIAERALKASEEKYRTILENMDEGFFEMDLDRHITFSNPALSRIFGYSFKELQEKGDQWFLDTEAAITLFKASPDVFRNKERFHAVDLEIARKDGEARIIEATITLVKDTDGTPRFFRGMLRDITERKAAERALSESVDKYVNILSNIADGYYEVDLKGNMEFANDALINMLNYPPEDLIGMNNTQFMSKATLKKVYQVFHQVYITGHSAKAVDWELIGKSGERHFIETSVSLRKDKKTGEPIGFFGTAHDITERLQAEIALQQSEARYREILDSIQDSYFEVDLKGNMTFVNKALVEKVGFTSGEFLGMNYRTYIKDPANQKKVFNMFNEVFRTGESQNAFDWQMTTKTGISLNAEASITLMKDSEERPIGFRGIVRDITERKAAEIALAESRQKYKSLVDNATDIIFELDNKGYITFFNPMMLKVLGHSENEADQVLGKHYSELVHEDQREEVINFYSIQAREKVPSTYNEFRAIRKNRVDLWVGQNVQALIVNDKITGFHIISRDITKRKLAEFALRESEQRNKKLADANDQGLFFHGRDHIIDVNQAMCTMLQLPREEIIGHDGLEFIDPDQREYLMEKFNKGYADPFEVDILPADGTKLRVEVKSSIIYDEQGKRKERLIKFTDISNRIINQTTGLPGKNLFKDRLLMEIKKARRSGNMVMVVFFDVDGLKKINDMWGHDAGDTHLRRVSSVMTKNIREVDTPSHFSGDEFAALFPDIKKKSDLVNRGRSLIRALKGTVVIKDWFDPETGLWSEIAESWEEYFDQINSDDAAPKLRLFELTSLIEDTVSDILRQHQIIKKLIEDLLEHSVSASFGFTVFDPANDPNMENDTLLVDRLIKEADTAMYIAKERGRQERARVNFNKEPLSFWEDFEHCGALTYYDLIPIFMPPGQPCGNKCVSNTEALFIELSKRGLITSNGSIGPSFTGKRNDVRLPDLLSEEQENTLFTLLQRTAENRKDPICE